MDGYGCLDYDDTDSMRNSDYSQSDRTLYESKSDSRIQTGELSSASDVPGNPADSRGMGDDKDISLLFGRFHYQSCRLKRNLKEMDIQQKHTQWVHERLQQLREEIMANGGADPGTIHPLPFTFNYDGSCKERAGGDTVGNEASYEHLLSENSELKKKCEELSGRKEQLESKLRNIVEQSEVNSRETQETIQKLRENVDILRDAYGEERDKADKCRRECLELKEKLEASEASPDVKAQLQEEISKGEEELAKIKETFEAKEKTWTEQAQKSEDIVKTLKKKFQEAKEAFYKVKLINTELDLKLRKTLGQNKELEESVRKLEDNKKLTKEVIETLEENNKSQQETISALREELAQQDEKLRNCSCKELHMKMTEQQQLLDDIEMRNKKLSEKCAVLKEEAHMMKELLRNTKGGKNWIDRLIKFSSYKVK